MLASLGLHALLLYALPLLKEAQRRLPAKMTARLVVPKPSEPVQQKAEASPPPSSPKSPAIRPAPAAKALPQPAPAVAPVLSAEPAKQAAGPALEVPAKPVAPPQAAPQAPAASATDPGTVAQFRLELMDLARRYKRYPRVAQDNNWEGRVELRIAIGEDGAISSLTLKKGSGRAVLDEEAQAMIRSAKSKATIPAALRGKAFVIEIPVDFALKE